MARSSDAPTSYDVARRAGVSQTTVSYVLHGRGGGKSRISEETRQRVMAAMNELGYMPNDTARSLRRRRTDRICLVLPRLGSPYSDALAQDVQRVASAHGYSMVITIGGTHERERQLVEQLQRGLADGAIIDSPGIDAAHLAPLVEAKLAIVLFNSDEEPNGFDVVRTTIADASYRAVTYLLDQGHRRIAILRHTVRNPLVTQRYASYARALLERGIAVDQRLVGDGAESRRDAFESAVRLFQLGDRPTAIFSESDIGAISAIWAAREVKLRVPEDVAVIGLGNIPEGEITRPGLTTVGPASLDFTDVADLLFSRLREDAPPEGRELLRSWTLISRESA